MKDVRGTEIKVGDICHIISKGNRLDIIATAVRTRGRGIKFVTDDEKTYTPDELSGEDTNIIIQSKPDPSCVLEIPPEEPQSGKPMGFTVKEVLMIEELKRVGWRGNLVKDLESGIKYQVTLG